MKPACKPASCYLKPCALLNNVAGVLPVRRSLLALVRRKTTWSENSFPLRNLSVCAFDPRAQGVSTPLARRRSNFSPSSSNLGLIHPTVHSPYQAFRDSAPCLSRDITPRRAPYCNSKEAHLVNTILNQSNRRRISTDRLNRKESQLVASLEGESSPTAGKIFKHSYAKARFRRAKTLGKCGLPLC